MVIVDIGSDFKRNHPRQRRNRFPDDGETAHKLQNLMRPFAKELGSPKRSERDRALMIFTESSLSLLAVRSNA
jgi:hypothetical protein